MTPERICIKIILAFVLWLLRLVVINFKIIFCQVKPTYNVGKFWEQRDGIMGKFLGIMCVSLVVPDKSQCLNVP